MTKATQKGTCQCCGRVLKVKNGNISRHGYKVFEGWHSGSCPGSQFPPLEVSCDRIKWFKEQLEVSIERYEAQIQELIVEDNTKVLVYFSGYKGRTFSEWTEERDATQMTEEEVDSLLTRRKVGMDWFRFERVREELGSKMEHSKRNANRLWEAQRLSRIIKDLRTRIAGYEETIEAWEPKELMPL